MLFADMSLTVITPCKPFCRILAVRYGAEILVPHAVAMTGPHVAIEISTSVGAFEGTVCYETLEGFVMRFDMFAISLDQC